MRKKDVKTSRRSDARKLSETKSTRPDSCGDGITLDGMGWFAQALHAMFLLCSFHLDFCVPMHRLGRQRLASFVRANFRLRRDIVRCRA